MKKLQKKNIKMRICIFAKIAGLTNEAITDILSVSHGHVRFDMNLKAIENADAGLLQGIRFYGISEVAELTGWSEKTVQKMFNDPKFPMADFGKGKIVLENALVEYFSARHEKSKDRYWRK